MIICFKVNGQPQGKARPRFSRKSGTVYTPKTTLDYDVYGHHSIAETNYDTDVKLTFEFGNSNAPDAGAVAVLEEGMKYALNHRAQGSLFEDNGGDKDEE